MKSTCIPKIAILFGFLLNIVGFVGFFGTGSIHYTALIPSILGVIMIISGILGFQEKLRRHVMHLAVLVALIGFSGTISSLLKLPALLHGEDLKAASDTAKIATSLLCGGFFLICLKWFLNTRKVKQETQE